MYAMAPSYTTAATTSLLLLRWRRRRRRHGCCPLQPAVVSLLASAEQSSAAPVPAEPHPHLYPHARAPSLAPQHRSQSSPQPRSRPHLFPFVVVELDDASAGEKDHRNGKLHGRERLHAYSYRSAPMKGSFDFIVPLASIKRPNCSVNPVV